MNMQEQTLTERWQAALKARFGTERNHDWALSPQIYADHAVRHGWRVSENVLTGRAHLQNPKGKRVVWGSVTECLAAMDKQAGHLPPLPSRMVIYLHGLGLMRFNDRFSGLIDALAENDIACSVVRYPSILGSLSDHSLRLAQLITRMGDVKEIGLVGHSMGGLLIRKLLDEPLFIEKGPKLKCVVMLGTPNQGAKLADRVTRLKTLEKMLGRGVEAVRPDHARELPIPKVPTLIIAGSTGKKAGYNPLLGADNDWMVRVDETRLEGAEGPILVRNDHFTLTENPEAIQLTASFVAKHLSG